MIRYKVTVKMISEIIDAKRIRGLSKRKGHQINVQEHPATALSK
jgi:hypothetical protein